MLFNYPGDISQLRDSCKRVNLSNLHEESYRMLMLLLPRKYVAGCRYVSVLKAKSKLLLSIDACHAFTTDISLQYQFEGHDSEQIVIRLYLDADMAELLHATEFEKQLRVLGPQVSTATQVNLRIKQNIFLNKWLVYLLDNGYQMMQWQLLLDEKS